MKGSRIMDLLGIRYPIIQGVVGGKHIQLAAAVSEAGGLGVLHGLSVVRQAGENRKVSDSIQEMRRLTSKPFSMNIPVSMISKSAAEELVSTVIGEGMKIVTTSAGDPMTYTRRLKAANIKVLHVVANVSHAIRAADAGVDVVIASGFEAGGWQSREEVTTFALVPQVVDALQGRIPVVAAGGIGDARGLLAAFSLGAEGVQLGTRFMASIEASLDEGVREALLKARDDSTEIVSRGERPARNYRIDFLKEVRPGYTRPPAGPGGAGGQVSGLIKEILSVDEIMRRLVKGTRAELDRLTEQLASFVPGQRV